MTCLITTTLSTTPAKFSSRQEESCDLSLSQRLKGLFTEFKKQYLEFRKNSLGNSLENAEFERWSKVNNYHWVLQNTPFYVNQPNRDELNFLARKKIDKAKEKADRAIKKHKQISKKLAEINRSLKEINN